MRTRFGYAKLEALRCQTGKFKRACMWKMCTKSSPPGFMVISSQWHYFDILFQSCIYDKKLLLLLLHNLIHLNRYILVAMSIKKKYASILSTLKFCKKMLKCVYSLLWHTFCVMNVKIRTFQCRNAGNWHYFWIIVSSCAQNLAWWHFAITVFT